MMSLENITTGHVATDLAIDRKAITFNQIQYPYEFCGLDKAPAGVESVELIRFTDIETSQVMDAARITIKPGSATPIQHFVGPRIFIDTVLSGEALWLGHDLVSGESISHTPKTTYPDAGAIVYGLGWTGRWINIGKKPLIFLELCLPPYQEDNTVKLPDTFNSNLLDSFLKNTFPELIKS